VIKQVKIQITLKGRLYPGKWTVPENFMNPFSFIGKNWDFLVNSKCPTRGKNPIMISSLHTRYNPSKKMMFSALKNMAKHGIK
jgi:hypothetical protein